jgi:threonylcarbamoyladenosine tRNA methylthiotransferase MtaB
LLDVIKSIALIDGIKRIRLGSLEPRIISEDFISQLSKIDKVCPHFHLSLQSGCNDTLKRMNRKYTVEEFFEGCNILRKYYNEPALTTDVIVGFAGETEDEFETTYKYLQKIKFAQMHIFKYSKRKGTVAERMPNQVTEDIKTQRSKELLAMSSRYNEEYQKLFINTNQQVLIEEKVSIDNEEYYIGHTDRYVKVAVFSTKNIENEIICVNIMGQLTNDILKAKMI